MIWVRWPKKAAKVRANITEDVIRDVALPMRLVDVKVCSVDDNMVRPQAGDTQRSSLKGDKRMTDSTVKPIALATLVSGTLDILFAMILTAAFGRQIPDMLRFVASGPYPAATDMGGAGAILGLVVHFALMAIMATAFVLLVRMRPVLLDTPWRTALAFGVITYFAMNWLVVPLRFDAPLPPKTLSIATQLFAHTVLVGVPFAFITRRYLRG